MAGFDTSRKALALLSYGSKRTVSETSETVRTEKWRNGVVKLKNTEDGRLVDTKWIQMVAYTDT